MANQAALNALRKQMTASAVAGQQQFADSGAYPHTHPEEPSVGGPLGINAPDSVQGRFGVSLDQTNPMWAKWFDTLHGAGVSFGGPRPARGSEGSVQPGPGNLTTIGHAPGELPTGTPGGALSGLQSYFASRFPQQGIVGPNGPLVK